jgi:hypothetical protein
VRLLLSSLETSFVSTMRKNPISVISLEGDEDAGCEVDYRLGVSR